MPANDNLDLILRRHEEIGARLTEGSAAPNTPTLSRELAELDPVVDGDQGLARQGEGARRPRGDARRSRPRAGNARDGARPSASARPRTPRRWRRQIRIALLPKDAADEGNVILEVRAGTGGDEAALFAGDLFRMYVQIRRGARLEGRHPFRQRGDGGRLQGNHRGGRRPRRVRPAQVRERRASRAARAGHRDARPHPHLGGDRRGAAGGRGNRLRHQRGRSEDRHHARQRRRRPARQQDGIGDPHHPSADRRRRRGAGGALAASQPRQGDGAAALAHSRRASPAARCGARRRTRRDPGRLRRPLAAHPHLQFPAGPGDRPPHQPDALFARPG